MRQRVLFWASVAITACAMNAVGLADTGPAKTVLAVDASAQPPAPETGYLSMGTAKSATGQVIGINSQYLTLDGKPWLPVMGEFHYARFPARYWEEQLLKMKAAGVTVVSTYIFWQYHEETEGHFVWKDDLDLRRFVSLCQKHGLYVFLRPGPWAHAEVRYGGIPDWVVDSMPTRRNDPQYLTYVGRFYQQIADQVKGLMWKDGGPIIGAQVENEYNLSGPGRGRDHIAALKKLLVKAGIDVPLYTVTGWDDTVYPKGEVTPVFGGYPDEPWDRSADKMPPKSVYSFQFNSRVSKGLGAETEASGTGDGEADMAHTPFLSAEFGGGVPAMYRRRPVIQPDDIAALLPVQLGSGVNLFGYYMFQGGQNPAGRPSREENTAIGGYNDLPKIGYDFGAPLGEYGQQHPVLAKLRPFHYFLRSWGEVLAPMSPHQPALLSKGPGDLTTPRFSVRSLGDRGFLFVSNHVRQYAMAAQTGVQFSVKFPGSTVTFPRTPVSIPTDAYFIWPINLDLGATTLRWATAQPLTKIDDLYVFHAIDGIPVELAFDAATTQSVGGAAHISTIDGTLIVEGLTPGKNALLTVKAQAGKIIRILVLTQAEGEAAWVVGSHLIETDAQLFASPSAIELRSIGSTDFSFGFFPALAAAPKADLPLRQVRDDGVFQTFEGHAKPARIDVTVSPLRPALTVPPIVIGGTAKAALEPTPETFGASGAWNIAFSGADPNSVSDAFLQIDYQGDVARLFSGTTMIDDQFYNGEPWVIGLKRYAREIKDPLTLTILPLRKDAPIYIEEQMRPAFPENGQIATISGIKVTPEYRVRVDMPK